MKTAAANANILMDGVKACVLTSIPALDFLNTDDQATSADYNRDVEIAGPIQINKNWKGLTWGALSEYPNQSDGTPGGLPRNTKTVNSKANLCIETSFCFIGSEMYVVYPEDRAMVDFRLAYDEERRGHWVKVDAYIGAGYPNPKSMGLALNLIDIAGNFQAKDGSGI